MNQAIKRDNDLKIQYISGLKIQYIEDTIHFKSPRHFLLDKIICEHLYELVITIG